METMNTLLISPSYSRFLLEALGHLKRTVYLCGSPMSRGFTHELNIQKMSNPFKYTSFIKLLDVYEMECHSELLGACFSCSFCLLLVRNHLRIPFKSCVVKALSGLPATSPRPGSLIQ